MKRQFAYMVVALTASLVLSLITYRASDIQPGLNAGVVFVCVAFFSLIVVAWVDYCDEAKNEQDISPLDYQRVSK